MPMFRVTVAAIVVQAGFLVFVPAARVWNGSVLVHAGYGSAVSFLFFLLSSVYRLAYSLNYHVSNRSFFT